ncbi:MAG TPA: hypothetical protein VE988_07290 [Gemmataceae bacterium]|nr:hypothetical protein [Gemmataceae bacterium]
MRRLFCAALAALLPLLLERAAAAQGADPRTIIERAITAQGGLENLNRAKASVRKTKGIFPGFFPSDPKDLKFTGESFSDAYDRSKAVLHGNEDNPVELSMAVLGNNGWDAFNGIVLDFDAKRKKQMAIAIHADKVASLISLLKDEGYTLTLLVDTKVKNMAARVIRVRYQGKPDIDLFFDKGTGHLVKTAYQMIDETEKQYYREAYYSRFEEHNPAVEPLKLLKSAKLSVENADLLTFLKDRIPTKDEQEKIDLLIVELGRAAYAAREKASAALRKFGPKAAGALRVALKSNDPEVARRAQLLVDEIAAYGGEAGLVTAVVRLLAVRRPPGTAEALLTYLPRACDDSVLKELKFALASVVEVDKKARAAVEAAMKDADPQCKEAARVVLGDDDGAFLKQPWRRMVIEGITLPMMAQVYRDGHLYLSIETLEMQFYNGFDDALFAKPKE